MNETQETIVWVDAPILGNRSKMSQDGRFTIEQKAGYYFLRDTKSGTTEPCNKKRLSLKGCKALAEEIVAGEKEDNQTKEGEGSHPPTNVVSQNEDTPPPGFVQSGAITTSEEVHVPTNPSTEKCSRCGLQTRLSEDGICDPCTAKEINEGWEIVYPDGGFSGADPASGKDWTAVTVTCPESVPEEKQPEIAGKLEIKRVSPPPKEKTLVSMDYKELKLPGFSLSKVLTPPKVPFRVMTMNSAESRTKTKSRGMKVEDESLRGGTTAEVVNPVPVVHHKLKTREEVQQILNRLMVEKGVNLPNWADWIPILKENGVDPIEVKQGMLATAEKWAREHAEEEAAKKRQPRQVALEYLPLGTTFRIPSMADTFDVGVLLDKNPASAKVRITQGCKDREMDWSLGTLVVVVGKVALEKHRPSGDNETQAPKVEDVLLPWETTEDEMKIRIDVAKKLLVALGLAATAVKKMSAKKVATKINSIEKHLGEADKVEGENLKLLEKIADWRQENADGTIKIVGGDDEESPEEAKTPAEEQEEETEQKEEDEVKETKEKAPKKGKKAKPEKAPKEEVQEKPAKKTKPKTEENGKEEKKTKTGKARVEGNGKTPREGSMVDIILNRLKKGPVSKDDLLKAVDQAFPGRDPKTQKNTVQWQLATGIPRKGIKVEKNEDGKFFVKK